MERNAEDFAAKYEKVYQDMFRFALYTLKNRHEAEDVVSETVLDAWKGIEGLKDENAFRAWIFRILANKCRQKLKSYLNRAVELPADLAWRILIHFQHGGNVTRAKIWMCGRHFIN